MVKLNLAEVYPYSDETQVCACSDLDYLCVGNWTDETHHRPSRCIVSTLLWQETHAITTVNDHCHRRDLRQEDNTAATAEIYLYIVKGGN